MKDPLNIHGSSAKYKGTKYNPAPHPTAQQLAKAQAEGLAAGDAHHAAMESLYKSTHTTNYDVFGSEGRTTPPTNPAPAASPASNGFAVFGPEVVQPGSLVTPQPLG